MKLCWLGLHRPYYKYDTEPGKTIHKTIHLGWHCRDCGNKYKKHVRVSGYKPSIFRLISTYYQKL